MRLSVSGECERIVYVLKLGSCVERKENIDYKKREDYTDQREHKNLIDYKEHKEELYEFIFSWESYFKDSEKNIYRKI